MVFRVWEEKEFFFTQAFQVYSLWGDYQLRITVRTGYKTNPSSSTDKYE